LGRGVEVNASDSKPHSMRRCRADGLLHSNVLYAQARGGVVLWLTKAAFVYRGLYYVDVSQGFHISTAVLALIDVVSGLAWSGSRQGQVIRRD
jgi:hypothetical protein